MANTLTGLIPVIYDAFDIVARELTGFINHAYRNSSAEQAALNQSVSYPITPAATTADIVPGQTPPDDGDQAIGIGTMTISKSKYSPVRWAGEEQRSVKGIYRDVQVQQFAQSFRALGNLIEIDCGVTAVAGASRAVGTAGATPFGTASDLTDFSNSLQVLDDNGAPSSDRHIVVNSAAMSNLRGKQSVLFKVNEAGTDALLRRGIVGDVLGYQIGNSAGLTSHVKGTGASYVTSGSTAVGVGSIALVTGTGTVLAGDIVTFAADTVNKYVVNTGVAAPGTIVLGTPGARVVIGTANALTVGNTFTPNIAFHRMALHLVTRAPAMPIGADGKALDAADDVLTITDDVTGLTFQVAMYRLYRRIKYEVGIAWGTKAVKSDFIVILQG
jgi:hypothetical protein